MDQIVSMISVLKCFNQCDQFVFKFGKWSMNHSQKWLKIFRSIWEYFHYVTKSCFVQVDMKNEKYYEPYWTSVNVFV